MQPPPKRLPHVQHWNSWTEPASGVQLLDSVNSPGLYVLFTVTGSTPAETHEPLISLSSTSRAEPKPAPRCDQSHASRSKVCISQLHHRAPGRPTARDPGENGSEQRSLHGVERRKQRFVGGHRRYLPSKGSSMQHGPNDIGTLACTWNQEGKIMKHL